MKFALYDRKHGYYPQHLDRIGKSGDYVTGPTTSPLFGQILADALLELSSRKPPRSMIEFGGGKGYLADDILERLPKPIPYFIIEKIPKKQKEDSKSIRRLTRLSDVPERYRKNAVIIANEFLDALPFHWISATQNGLREIYITRSPTNPREVEGPLSTKRIAKYFEQLSHHPLPGNRMEVSLASLDWLRQIHRLCQSSLLLIIDYGRSAEQLLCFPRPKGTLRCFSGHQVDDNPYEKVGQKDITADVNWTAIEQEAERLGFQKDFFLSQGRFLVHFGQKLLRERRWSQKELLGFQTLVHPEWMGEAFQVMVLRFKRS